MKKRILTIGEDRQDNHRSDFESCPHCEHQMKDAEWDQCAVELIIEPRCYKSGYVIIMSECPKCHGKSWVHNRMATIAFGCWPQSWKDAVEKRDCEDRLDALREWGKGLCWRCKKLESGTVDYHAWRNCRGGCGSPEIKCEHFEEI
jgi:hypothetical protein